MEIENIKIRPATKKDATKVQWIRKQAWQHRYINPESGVTKELLESTIAKLPPTKEDTEYFEKMLDKPGNKGKNLVAVLEEEVIGVVFYDEMEGGTGDIGVFVENELNGKGVGDRLLEELIEKTNNSLKVEIFAKNPSREFYKIHGFMEAGPIEKHYFSKDVYLPVQVLQLTR